MCAHGYVATVTVENFLLMVRGAAKAYSIDELPAIVPVRIATDGPWRSICVNDTPTKDETRKSPKSVEYP